MKAYNVYLWLVNQRDKNNYQSGFTPMGYFWQALVLLYAKVFFKPNKTHSHSSKTSRTKFTIMEDILGNARVKSELLGSIYELGNIARNQGEFLTYDDKAGEKCLGLSSTELNYCSIGHAFCKLVRSEEKAKRLYTLLLEFAKDIDANMKLEE